MKLYLDNSFLNRPFDDPSIPRNQIETGILRAILDRIISQQAFLITSSVIEYENSLNPHPERKAFISELLRLATIRQNYTASIARRAHELHTTCGLTNYDARHMASAEAAEADYFITSDLSLIKKYRGNLTVIEPLLFFKQHDNHNKKY